jgi:NADP-dependent 3-hydroxy acid dehydrogenase YdfG
VAQVKKQFGTIDCLLNNAGVAFKGGLNGIRGTKGFIIVIKNKILL